MALPVRQGRLFPGVEKSTKKFGRHLATIKYNLLLSPLIIAHIYKHKDAEDYSSDSVVATGLKLRIDSFMLDLHQRREEFVTQSKGRLKNTTTTGMRINKAQLDFISADIRAVSANIAGTSLGKIKHATDADVASFHDQAYTTPDISRFTIPDNDLIWIDMDDFVELDWILPVETHPETKIMPLAFSPRFTYFRQTDHNGNVSGDSGRTSHFGDEPTHFCIMSQDNDPQRVQHDLIQQRVAALKEERDAHKHTLGEQELKVVRDGARDPSIREHHDLLAQQYRMIEDKLRFMQYMLKNLSEKLNIPSDGDDCSHPTYGLHDSDRLSDLSDNADMDNDDATSSTEFNNRFTVHNIQLKWNNPLRNIILRYVHQVSQRRGFVYYMSRRAVKFILDIVEEQNRSKGNMNHAPQQYTPTTQPSPSVSFKDDPSDINLEERIKDILKDGKSFVDANDPHKPENPSRQASGKMEQGIAEEFTAQNNYHVRLIAPQIQLQSAKNAKSVLLVTAKAMQLKVIQIMDKTRLADDVSGLVQRRFSVDMDGVQSFVTNQRTLNNYLHLYSANRYGSPKNSAWPPWVPLEVNFDFQLNPFGWFRVIQKTSASLRYDKYNTLRLKYNDEVSKGELDESNAPDDTETRIDHLWVEFPHIRAMCDSSQYYAMYVIVLDLLLYSEPLEKIRNERLEKIMLAADFSDLTGAPEMVVSLQERIRQLEEIKGHFQLHARYLDRQGWLDRLAIEKDLVNCENELFFMMKAITTSQRKYDDRGQNTQSNGLLRWYLSASEIVWHLMRENNEPLMEIQLKHAAYDRTDNSDGSNHNTMEIERIHGLNLLPDALYPEMIAPFFENGPRTENRNGDSIKMFKVQWYMLEAIAGIPVLDQFEVNLFPLKIQLEREVGKKLFEYIFPGNAESVNASPFLVKHMPPMDDGPDDSDSELNAPITPSSLTSDSGETGASTRSGSLELRLRPTLTLSDLTSRPSTSSSSKPRTTGGGSISRESHRFKLFQNQHRSLSAPRSRTATAMPLPKNPSRRKSGESLRGSGVVETPVSTSSTNLERTKRFGIHRTSSKDSGAEKEKASDDLTEMMSRASNYMTLAYVKIPSVVLCLSYKGKGERNLEDVHDFVFRMPTLEYRNKTWSNLDLALRLKKDVIKALISHTGAIIGNKFSHHRPSKTQQSRLREIANSSSLLRNTRSLSSSLSRTSTPRHRSSSRERSGQALNSTFIAGWGSLNRTFSDASSFDSMISPKNKGPGVSVDAQTPNTHDLSPPSTETGLANRSDTDSFVGSDLETEEPLEIDSNQFLAPSRSGTDVDNTRAR